MRGFSAKKAAVLVVVAANVFPACLVGVMLILTFVTGNHVSDFLSYWAASKQLVHHANPYDADSVFRLQLPEGLPHGTPAVLMRNPPVIFPLVYPLGYLGPAAATRVWMLVLAICFAGSVAVLGRVYRQDRRLWLVLAFEPALHCLTAEQIGLILALSLSLFLYFHEKRPFLAGAALSLLALKPHLFVPGMVVVAAWAFWERRVRLIAGAAIGTALLCAAAWFIDPLGWHEYRALLHDVAVGNEWIPCVSILLRSRLPGTPMWAQYVPSILASIAAFLLYLKDRESWDWRERTPMLIALGIFTAPYTWFTDQAALVPLAVYALSRPVRLVIAFAVLNAVLMLLPLASVNLHSEWLAWSSVVFFAWTVFDRWSVQIQERQRALKPVLSTE